MITHNIFQTPLFAEQFNGLTDQCALIDYVNSNELQRGVSANLPTDKIVIDKDLQTVNHNMQHNRILKPLCSKILEAMNKIVAIYQYDAYEVEITSMWGNIQKPGTHFRRHAHDNHMFSGVFYLNYNEHFPSITFWRPVESSFSPQLKLHNEFNQELYSYKPNKDELIIFPSWLQHSVDKNNTDENRINIAFNVMLRGTYHNINL